MKTQHSYFSRLNTLALSGFILAAGFMAPQQANADDFVQVGQMAPNFTFTTTKNQSSSLSALRGKVVVVNFFATWCGACRTEMPYLQWLYRRQRGANFSLISLGIGHSNNEVANFASYNKLSFTFAADPQYNAVSKYASGAIPRTYVIDPYGRIVYQMTGFSSEGMGVIDQLVTRWKAATKRVAKAKPASKPKIIAAKPIARSKVRVSNVKFPQMPKETGQGVFLLEDGGVRRIK